MAPWLREHRESTVVRELGGIVVELADAEGSKADRLHKAIRRIAARRDPARSGELHRWMYDEASLARLLARCDFREIRRVAADQSRIPGWNEFGLDLDADGRPHQPGSVWMEAVR
jgi:hypothetical protein